jgi:hypothetical protein
MKLIIKIKNNPDESEISRIIKYLKSQKCVRKIDLVIDDLNSIKNIFDKETVNSIHCTASMALSNLPCRETESIF